MSDLLPTHPLIRPEKTAISRKGPSTPTRILVKSRWLAAWNISSILDYGCGYGKDVAYLSNLGFDVAGYDPHTPFGFHHVQDRTFDLVLLIYVLNVLPSASLRVSAIRDAARYLSPTARLLIVTRGFREIERLAHGGNWPPHSDGYLSSQSKGTFQRGITVEEISSLAAVAGLRTVSGIRLRIGDTPYIVAQHP